MTPEKIVEAIDLLASDPVWATVNEYTVDATRILHLDKECARITPGDIETVSQNLAVSFLGINQCPLCILPALAPEIILQATLLQLAGAVSKGHTVLSNPKPTPSSLLFLNEHLMQVLYRLDPTFMYLSAPENYQRVIDELIMDARVALERIRSFDLRETALTDLGIRQHERLVPTIVNSATFFPALRQMQDSGKITLRDRLMVLWLVSTSQVGDVAQFFENSGSAMRIQLVLLPLSLQQILTRETDLPGFELALEDMQDPTFVQNFLKLAIAGRVGSELISLAKTTETVEFAQDEKGLRVTVTPKTL